MTDIDHPVGDLAHAKASSMAKLLFLLLTWIRVIRVTVKPSFEVISGLLRKLAALSLRTVDECGGGHRWWGARGG